MPRYASKPGVEEPYTIPNKGPAPKIDSEEGLPPGGLDIAWVEDSKKNDYHWSRGMPWHERLHAHATMNSARRNAKCKRPFEPKDELDLVLGAAYCPTKGVFFEKTDPYLQIETALGEDLNLKTEQLRAKGMSGGKEMSGAKGASGGKEMSGAKGMSGGTEMSGAKGMSGGTEMSGAKGMSGGTETSGAQPSLSSGKPKPWEPQMPLPETWRLLRNRIVIYPDKSPAKGYDIASSNGGVDRRENIYNVKLGIAAYHSPQTNPGYSRTPSGAFYSI